MDKKLLDLNAIAGYCPFLSKKYVEAIAEAASVCLDNQCHKSPTDCKLSGKYTDTYMLEWPKIAQPAKNAWGDLTEATEHGAYAIAFAVVSEFTPYTVLAQARKKNGNDYFLHDSEVVIDEINPFKNLPRLEVSGILEDKSAIADRVRRKTIQIARGDEELLGSKHVVIVEYSTPETRYVSPNDNP